MPRRATLWLSFLALLGIVSSPYFCVKFSPTNYKTENSHIIIVNSEDGKTVQISASICSILTENNSTESPHDEHDLIKSCFYCLLNHAGYLLPSAVVDDSMLVKFLKTTKFDDQFIVTHRQTNSQSRAPPIILSFIV